MNNTKWTKMHVEAGDLSIKSQALNIGEEIKQGVVGVLFIKGEDLKTHDKIVLGSPTQIIDGVCYPLLEPRELLLYYADKNDLQRRDAEDQAHANDKVKNYIKEYYDNSSYKTYVKKFPYLGLCGGDTEVNEKVIKNFMTPEYQINLFTALKDDIDFEYAEKFPLLNGIDSNEMPSITVKQLRTSLGLKPKGQDYLTILQREKIAAPV